MPMEIKAPNPIESLPPGALPALAAAYFELCHLKGLYRQGWLKRGVPKARCESVAEHSFGATVLALWLAEAHFPELDCAKVLRMALLHDFGEIYTGDLIPSDEVSAQDKSRLEHASIKKVFAKLPNGDEYIRLWEEFEAGQSAEARFVRQIDRLEMGMQAAVYRQGGLGELSEFFASTRAALSDAPLLDLLEQVANIEGTSPS